MKALKKYIFVGTFIFILFGFTFLSVIQKDNTISEIENKILSQAPKLTLESIKNGSYMKDFDEYVVDQFPGRMEIISLKNKLMSFLGYSEFKNIYIGKTGRMLEKFTINLDTVNNNLEVMNKMNDYFGIESIGMFIPNSIAIYKEELPSYAITDSQESLLNYISNNYKGKFYTPYDVLVDNKDNYIYFNTDHHWTQLGAKIMYEDYYNKKIKMKYEKVSDNFLGTYYSKSLINKNKADKIYSYTDLKNYEIKYDGLNSNSLYDESKLKGKNKYQYFMNGDPAMSLITGEGEGEVLIFKDSFAHCYIPFLAKEYSKIHVVDPRYSNINIVDYVKENDNIEKIYYIYSLTTLNSSNIFNKYKNLLK